MTDFNVYGACVLALNGCFGWAAVLIIRVRREVAEWKEAHATAEKEAAAWFMKAGELYAELDRISMCNPACIKEE